jgi:hypothetical protein
VAPDPTITILKFRITTRALPIIAVTLICTPWYCPCRLHTPKIYFTHDFNFKAYYSLLMELPASLYFHYFVTFNTPVGISRTINIHTSFIAPKVL